MVALPLLHSSPMRGPESMKVPQRGPLPEEGPSLPRVYANQWVHFYQNRLSVVMVSRCAMHPSCSVYCLHAIEQHGVLKGVVLTVDRLIHEGSEKHHVPRIWVEGQLRYDSPLENNTFWWRN